MLLPITFSNDSLQELENLFRELAEKAVNDLRTKETVKQYFNKKEAAEYIGVSFNTLKRFLIAGLPVVDIDGMQYIRKVDIDNFFEKNII
ncbi:helix-turn-helix domain-containing protein [Savagea sp. SN6]|uniref:Helix-turn-helix domain-containing protein n=2 Tax=Savagea serpentis TaxID=2785297 RepID=A0A8J7GAH6_9BACL|nr:helix-turn-helix domain-containing protein [Savagea serpentis]